LAEIRVPPHNLEAEQAILGGTLINNEALEYIHLTPEVFYREAHQHIFEAMQSLYDNNTRIDLITLSEYLKGKNLLEKAGGPDYIASLAEAVSTSAGIVHHAEIIKDLYVKRGILTDCSVLAESCLQNWRSKDELLTSLDHIATKYNDSQVKEDLTPIGEYVKSAFKQIETHSEIEGYITGLSTDFQDFDHITAGLQPSDLIILAARPGMGKTALALNIACNVAKQGHVAAVYSLEMSGTQLALRMLGSDARLNAMLLRSGKLKDSQWSSITNSAHKISDLPLYIDPSSNTTVQDIKYKSRKIQKKKGLSLIVVDYIQLMTGKGKAESRQLEISEISRGLKGIAKDFNIPVIALSQLSRKCEERPNKRPHMSDLRESGAIEQDADIVAFIYRDEVYNPTTEDNKNIAEIIIGKHRNGPTKTFKLVFNPEHTRFDDYIGEDKYPESQYYWQKESDLSL